MFVLHVKDELLNPVKAVFSADHAHAWTPPLVLSGTVKLLKLIFTLLKAFDRFEVVCFCHVLLYVIIKTKSKPSNKH